MKIGVITVHRSNNYGAMLQAFATQTVLAKLGCEVRFIDVRFRKRKFRKQDLMSGVKEKLTKIYIQVHPKQRKRLIRFKRFFKKLNLTESVFSENEIETKLPKFDLYLVGSDQVWNLENGINNYYFLDFVDGNKSVKLSYGSSFGTSEIPGKYKKTLASLLNDFKAISVREYDGVDIVREVTGKEAVHVLDPTFLISKAEWDNYISDCKSLNYDYILIYALNNTKESVELVRAVKRRYNLPVVGIPMGIKVPAKFQVDIEFKSAGPLEFASLFRNAKVICTSSFHGLAFALNFEKTFFVMPHLTRNSRLNSMLKMIGLEDRQKYSPVDVERMHDSELLLDFSKVRPILDEMKNNSLNFLKNNIQTHRNF